MEGKHSISITNNIDTQLVINEVVIIRGNILKTVVDTCLDLSVKKQCETTSGNENKYYSKNDTLFLTHHYYIIYSYISNNSNT